MEEGEKLTGEKMRERERERNRQRQTERERERERERETDRQTDRQTESDKGTEGKNRERDKRTRQRPPVFLYHTGTEE